MKKMKMLEWRAVEDDEEEEDDAADNDRSRSFGP